MELVFHIGLIKTGTTYLQSQIFPYAEGVRYLRSNQSIFGRPLFSEQSRFLISDETMSGCPYWRVQRKMGYLEQFTLAVSRLKAIHPRARIICCFREPAAFLQSAYKQYLHEGGTSDFKAFYHRDGGGILVRDDLMFSYFIDCLHANFKEDDLFVYDYGDFRKNPVAVISEMFSFLGSSTDSSTLVAGDQSQSNPSVPLRLEGLLIKLNRLSQRFHKATGRRAQLRFGGKTLNARVFAQYIAPKFWKSAGATRDLSEIRSEYQADWQRCKAMMRQF